MYLTGTRLTLAIFLPIGCTVTVLAEPILTAWVGADYASGADLVGILILASFLDTSQWPAGSVLQGMGRHRPLAIIALVTGLTNLILSLVLVQYLGLMGVALGTLIPTSIGCMGFVLPYAMRVIGVSAREVLNEIVLPVFIPAIPMALVLYVWRHMLQPSAMVSLLTAGGVSIVVYMMGYLSAGVCKAERDTCTGAARSTIRIASGYLKGIC